MASVHALLDTISPMCMLPHRQMLGEGSCKLSFFNNTNSYSIVSLTTLLYSEKYSMASCV